MQDKSSDVLNKILKGDFDYSKIDPNSIVIESDRIRSDILVELVSQYRKEKVYTDKQIMDILLGLDEAVEKGLLNKELLDTVKGDPKIITNYINNLKK